jgi:ABC-2 type transport system permease protein
LIVPVLSQAVWRRRISLMWWCLGLVVAVALVAVSYPTVRDNAELDKTFQGLPPSVQAMLGLDPANALTSPVGYLNSQFYANLFPIVLLVFSIGLASWAIAGDEGAGTLELLLANPVSRLRVAVERAGFLVLMLALVTVAALVALIVLAPRVGLTKGLSLDNIVAASVATGLLSMVFAAIAFAAGAATGNRSLAVSVSSAVAVASFAVEGLGAQVKMLQPLRNISPWHWLLYSEPLRNGWVPEAWLLPLGAALALMAVGSLVFVRRDLR